MRRCPAGDYAADDLVANRDAVDVRGPQVIALGEIDLQRETIVAAGDPDPDDFSIRTAERLA
jgi:hypothetical protein